MPVLNLPLNRKLTKAFIAANPVTLVLIPRTKVKKPAGGTTWENGSPRDPQILTLIEQTGLSGQPKPVVTVEGIERVVEFVLLGEWDCQMETGDVYSFQGKDWEVVGLFYDNGYEKRGLVSARGQ